jgi:hypothetical protein
MCALRAEHTALSLDWRNRKEHPILKNFSWKTQDPYIVLEQKGSAAMINT